VLGRLFQTSDPGTEELLYSSVPRDDADVSIGRTEMTAPRVVGDKLAFFHQARQGLASQLLEYQESQFVLDSASHWHPAKLLQNQ